MTKLTSLGDAPAKQQDQPLSGAGESFIGKISGPIEKPVRRQKTRRTENAQVKEEAAQQTVSETKETKPKRTRTAQNTDAHKKTTKTVKSAPNGEKAPAKTTKSTQTKNNKGRGRRTKQKPSVRAYFLGGLNEIGKNFTLFECENDMVIVDCGLAFPDEEMPGIDAVIPDFTFVEKNKDRIRGIVITHGHEDHIGSLPYLLKKINVPVYGTALTVALIANKLKEHNLGYVKLNVTTAGSHIQLGCFDVELIHVNHSISDAVGLALHTPAGVIVHTGDFKIDFTPTQGGMIDLARFAQLGQEGVLLLMADSTNAERPGYTQTEQKVNATFDALFARAEANKKRLIIATFASNISRVQQIINCAEKYGRKVALSGRSMVNVMSIASELGYLKVPDGLLIDLNMISRYTKEQIVLITTGSQGEPMSGLTRMANSEHRKLQIRQGDTVIISATPIPGNEIMVSRIIDQLYRCGANVIYNRIADVHVSGHACQEELKLMHTLVKPKYFIPVHGEYRMLHRHAQLAQELGMPEDNVIILEMGQALELSEDEANITGPIPTGSVMVDGLGVGDVGNVVLRDRKHLSQDGLIIVVVGVNKETGQVTSGPELISRGFVYVRENEELISGARNVAMNVLQRYDRIEQSDWTSVKNGIKDEMHNYLFDLIKRNPMILPIIMET